MMQINTSDVLAALLDLTADQSREDTYQAATRLLNADIISEGQLSRTIRGLYDEEPSNHTLQNQEEPHMMMAYDNQGHFDLPAYLLAYVYEDAVDEETGRLQWSMADAISLADDLKRHNDIDADPQEIYEIMMEFDAQDAEDAQS